jgi:hypothetical protein
VTPCNVTATIILLTRVRVPLSFPTNQIQLLLTRRSVFAVAPISLFFEHGGVKINFSSLENLSLEGLRQNWLGGIGKKMFNT